MANKMNLNVVAETEEEKRIEEFLTLKKFFKINGRRS